MNPRAGRDDDCAATSGFGFVHRAVGGVQKLFPRFPRRAGRHADAARCTKGFPVDVERQLDDVQDLLRELFQLSSRKCSLHEDHELVPTEPCHRVRGPDHARHSPGEFPQHSVAGRVTVTIVDGLEVVEIEIEQCQLGTVALASGKRLRQTIVQQITVRKPCELVVLRHAGEFFLERLVFSHILTHHVDSADFIVVGVIG